MTKEEFEQKCYEAYQLDWMLSHRFSLQDLLNVMEENRKEVFDPDDYKEAPFDESDLARNTEQAIDQFLYTTGFGDSSIWVCKDEFLGAEFKDSDYMFHLLSIMPNGKEMEKFWRQNYSIGSRPASIEIPTSAGVIRAYESTSDPGQPGISVCVTPAGSDDEIDLAYISIYEDPEYATEDNERPVDIAIMAYGDPHTEDYTFKNIIRREDIMVMASTWSWVT